MTLIAPSRRALLTGATLAVTAVLATGCNSSSSGSSAAGAAATGTSTAAAAAGTGAAAAGAGASGATATPASAAGQAGAPACTAADLKAAINGAAGGGAAGSFYSDIDFTNTSSASCTLYGYPGVSLTSASGAQIGPAATRDASTASAVVTLAPGATAYAVLRQTDPTVYSTAQCQPVTSAYLKIYPPNQTASVQVPFKADTCASSSIKMLSIRVVSPSAG
jgi:hypothetical protein